MIGRLVPRTLVGPAATFAVLLGAAWLLAGQGNTYIVYLYGIGLVYATATLGLHLLVNDCGDISIAQGGQVALGAFVGAHMFGLVDGPLSPLLLIGGAVLAGAVSGAIVSVPMLKLRGLAVAVVTLLLNAAIFHFVLRFPEFVGGSGGIRLGATDWLPSTDAEAIGWLTVITVATIVVVQFLRRGRFGLGLRAVRANENLARSTGIPVEWYRTAAYIVAGGTAGVAGAMWLILHQGIAPSAFTDASSLLLLTLALLGGRGSIAGPMSAAIAMGVLTGLLGRYGVVVSFLAPVALLFVLIKHPGGLNEQLAMVARGLRALAVRLSGRGAELRTAQPGGHGADDVDVPGDGLEPAADQPTAAEPATRALLHCSGVEVAFGGLVAVGGVSLEVRAGEVLALVGPNGAGKTTLLNALSGHIRLTEGTVWLGGADVTRTPAHRRAAQGLRRTFQVGGHMRNESGFDHLRLGTHVHAGRSGHDGEDTISQITRELGLSREVLDAPLADLPAGTARLIEIGTALAAPGQVLLLDEPTVGLTQPERSRLDAILRSLAGGQLAIVLVDHDTAFIRRVAHRVVALNAGKIIAEGAPADVFAEPEFIAAYLGTSEVMA